MVWTTFALLIGSTLIGATGTILLFEHFVRKQSVKLASATELSAVPEPQPVPAAVFRVMSFDEDEKSVGSSARGERSSSQGRLKAR